MKQSEKRHYEMVTFREFLCVFVSLCFPVEVNNLQCLFRADKKVDCKTESS